MFYSIRHLTKFRYGSPVSESIMELRMQPRSEGPQRCLHFAVNVTPRTRVQSYRDYLGNVVHHFDVPMPHRLLTITAEALVDVAPLPDMANALDDNAWNELDSLLAAGDFWEMLAPSHFAHCTPLMEEFADELKVPGVMEARQRDPLGLLRELTAIINREIEYVPKSTRVDSPVDDALAQRQGVCQDFAHITIALVRRMGIPCRYVSGYLFHRTGEKPRSPRVPPTHGSRRTCPASGGPASIPPITWLPRRAMSARQLGATTWMCRLRAGSSRATPPAN